MLRPDRGIPAALAAALLLPLISMAIVPFYDTSEPRYAEIARFMAQTGDWITPWFSPGVPFWGKPPLSFWAQALSMKLFGYSEFAARLPSWICMLLTVRVLVAGLRTLRGPALALRAVLIYSTCALVYITSGAVLTDPFLALGTTLSMMSFAVATSRADHGAAASTGWRYGFFVGLTIGLLAKGPLAAVLVGAPIALWAGLHRRSRWRIALPWVRGLVLTAALTLPWYILAEIKTPGFLDYFIIGEHFRRFLDPGWSGDLYGTAHRQIQGTIWLYWLQATFPWSLLMLVGFVAALRKPRTRAAIKLPAIDPMWSYWLAWALFTPLFFTFSANILWTYVLPSIAAFSILVAMVIEALPGGRADSEHWMMPIAALVPVVVLGLSIATLMEPNLRNTERGLVRYAARHGAAGTPLLYLSKPPFSARFYSDGAVRQLKPSDLVHEKTAATPFYLAIPKGEQSAAAEMLGTPIRPVYSNKRYVLIEIPPTGMPGSIDSGTAR